MMLEQASPSTPFRPVCLACVSLPAGAVAGDEEPAGLLCTAAGDCGGLEGGVGRGGGPDSTCSGETVCDKGEDSAQLLGCSRGSVNAAAGCGGCVRRPWLSCGSDCMS